MVPHQGPRARGRGRLLLVPRPRGRCDQDLRLPRRPRRDRGGAARPPRRRRRGRGRGAGPVRGQAVKAWVLLSPGHRPGEELAREIREFAKTTHSRFAYPREIEFVDELPRSATGKIQRAQLRLRHTQ
ncbi:hypothetical protein ACFQ0B_69785 [Nonomuraea thailandensis]